MSILTALALATAATSTFPERMPAMMEACLHNAMADGIVTTTEDSHKYMCVGEPARNLWDFLEAAKVESWEQDTQGEGRWLSRDFPLGGCFKQLSKPDGSSASGLSCTIWIPRLPDEKKPK